MVLFVKQKQSYFFLKKSNGIDMFTLIITFILWNFSIELDKENTNLSASPKFASTIHSRIVLNWFIVGHNLKNGGKNVD